MIKRLVRKIILKTGFDIIEKKTTFEYENLLTEKRYISKRIKLLNLDFKIPDAVTFYKSYHEIFTQKIYKFKTDKQKPLIIDCGSNYGISIVYFKKIFPNAIIIGYEADSSIYEYLKYNIDLRNYKDVTLHNLAIWNEVTELEFFSEGADGGRLINKSFTPKKINRIQTTTLSSIIKDRKVDMLKIDIEGAETEVLIECKEDLKNVENIFIEYHSFQNSEQTLDVILKILKESGFRYQIHKQFSSPTPLTLSKLQLGMDLQLNIFGYR